LNAGVAERNESPFETIQPSKRNHPKFDKILENFRSAWNLENDTLLGITIEVTVSPVVIRNVDCNTVYRL
jgi:hypothetical protein